MLHVLVSHFLMLSTTSLRVVLCLFFCFVVFLLLLSRGSTGCWQVTVIDDERLMDGMDEEWDPQVVADYVRRAVLEFQPTSVCVCVCVCVSRPPSPFLWGKRLS